MVSKEEVVWRFARQIAFMSKEARFDAFHLTDTEDILGYYSYGEAKKLYKAYRKSLQERGFA